MKTYKVYIHEKVIHEFEVEAEGSKEALDKGYELLSNDKMYKLLANKATTSLVNYMAEGEYLEVHEVYEV